MQYTLSIPGTAPNPTKKKRKAGARRKPRSGKAPSKPRAKSRKRRVAPAAAAPAPKRRRRRRVAAAPTTAKKPARRRRSQAARPKVRRRRGRRRNPIPGLNFQFSEIATFGAGVAVLEYGMRNLVGPRFSTGPVGAVVKAALGFGLGELLKRLRLVSPSIARSVQAAGIAVGVTELVKVGLERVPNILNKPLLGEMRYRLGEMRYTTSAPALAGAGAPPKALPSHLAGLKPSHLSGAMPSHLNRRRL